MKENDYHVQNKYALDQAILMVSSDRILTILSLLCLKLFILLVAGGSLRVFRVVADPDLMQTRTSL